MTAACYTTRGINTNIYVHVQTFASATAGIPALQRNSSKMMDCGLFGKLLCRNARQQRYPAFEKRK